MHGLINFLISRSQIAHELRKRVIFKLIPMANPDGVIVGNNRSSLLGKDMNRQYNMMEEVDEKLAPVTTAIRKLV